MSEKQQAEQQGSGLPVERQMSGNLDIPSRTVVVKDPADLPNSYQMTPGGTMYSTTPGG